VLVVAPGCVGRYAAWTPSLEVLHGVVGAFAMYGSAVMLLRSVARRTLARQPKGVWVSVAEADALASREAPKVLASASNRHDRARDIYVVPLIICARRPGTNAPLRVGSS
jgi:hypothetical protein